MNQTLPVKSRQDVVDTLIQYQQELRVLRYLLFLFCIAVAYEYLYVPYMETEDVSPDLSIARAGNKKVVPPGRLVNLQVALEGVMQKSPVFRQVFVGEIASLSAVSAGLLKNRDDPGVRQDLTRQVERLWRFSHHPSWSDPTLFKVVNAELKALMLNLDLRATEGFGLPPLDFGPHRLRDGTPARRDLFRFVGAAPVAVGLSSMGGQIPAKNQDGQVLELYQEPADAPAGVSSRSVPLNTPPDAPKDAGKTEKKRESKKTEGTSR